MVLLAGALPLEMPGASPAGRSRRRTFNYAGLSPFLQCGGGRKRWQPRPTIFCKNNRLQCNPCRQGFRLAQRLSGRSLTHKRLVEFRRDPEAVAAFLGPNSALSRTVALIRNIHGKAFVARVVRAGLDESVAEPWGHAVIGMLHMVALWWLREPATERDASRLSRQLTELLWDGLGFET